MLKVRQTYPVSSVFGRISVFDNVAFSGPYVPLAPASMALLMAAAFPLEVFDASSSSWVPQERHTAGCDVLSSRDIYEMRRKDGWGFTSSQRLAHRLGHMEFAAAAMAFAADVGCNLVHCLIFKRRKYRAGISLGLTFVDLV